MEDRPEFKDNMTMNHLNHRHNRIYFILFIPSMAMAFLQSIQTKSN